MKHLDAAATLETSAATDTSHDTGEMVEPQEPIDSEELDEGSAQSDVDSGHGADAEPVARSSSKQVRVSSLSVIQMADFRSATEGRVTRSWLTRWLVTAEQLTPRQVFWLAFGVLFVLMSAWAFYVPAMSAADEPAHM